MTMDAGNQLVSAMGVYSGTLIAVGSPQSVERSIHKLQSKSGWFAHLFGLRRIDLQGKTVLPGFVDAHSHFPASGIASAGIDVSSPPFGTNSSVESILSSVADQSHNQSDERWIIGFNYDDAGLQEKRHPTREELDLAAPDHAVYLRHRSGHMGVANSRALIELGIEPGDAGEQAAGAAIDSKKTDLWSRGLLQEHAAPGLSRLLKELPWWKLPGIVFRARDEYLHAGVTTVQNGFADKQTLQILRWSARLGIVPQRMVLWPAHDKLDHSDVKLPPISDNEPQVGDSGLRLAQAISWPEDASQNLKIGAIKLVADGSPQGRTAWLTKPYLQDDNLSQGYDGLAYLQREKLHRLISQYHHAGIQLAIHGNGDAAVQSIIDGIRLAQKQYPRSDARHILVHAQVINDRQLSELSELDVGVSFFPTHTYYWGDWYRFTVLGEQRARVISPLASADAAGVRYSIHADSPVTPMNPMQMLWSSTERRTTSGYLLGANQRVSRLRALRAMTIDAAWQNFLEDDRGSLEPGKLADFIVLSEDPLLAKDVRQISVLETWIAGKRRFP